MVTPKQTLQQQVTRFCEWAEAYAESCDMPVSELGSEWEFEYEDWQSLYQAVFAVLDTLPTYKWDEETDKLLLFALARDNEGEIIATELERRPKALLVLARASLRSAEDQAKWQIASRLSGMSEQPAEARSLLELLAVDKDEYVCRRALISLGILGSPSLEGLVDAAWATGNVYQRMAALTALQGSRSARLNDFLVKADLDGRQYLVAHASKIRAGAE